MELRASDNGKTTELRVQTLYGNAWRTMPSGKASGKERRVDIKRKGRFRVRCRRAHTVRLAASIDSSERERINSLLKDL